jgi:hypothetical protein
VNELKARLDALRGSGERKNLDARALSALTANPACHRRSVLDAAGINKQLLGAAVGFEMPASRSQFALTRGVAFEAQVKANGCAQLLTLLREVLELPVDRVSYDDCETVGGNPSQAARNRDTTRRMSHAASQAPDAGTLFDHPLLRLVVAGHPVYLEPDLIAFRFRGRFYVVEIKSFSIIDGQAPAASVAAAELQAAVYVHAMQEMLRAQGLDTGLVASVAVLVCPKDFTNQPTAVKMNVTNHLAAVRRQLSRMHSLDEIVACLPTGMTLDLWRDPDRRLDPRPAHELTTALRCIDAHYVPQCLSICELAKFCRREEHGKTAVLGRQTQEELGGLESLAEVIGLATGTAPVGDQAEQARLLEQAYRYRSRWLDGAA